MSPSPSTSTPRSCVPPASAFKTAPITPSEESYFLLPAYSTIPVATPLLPSQTSPQTSPTTHPPESIENRFRSSEPEMLHPLAMTFPPPPTLSLPAYRHSAPEPVPPRVSTCHRSAIPLDALPSPMDRSRRSPSSSYFPLMDVSSSSGKHTLHVQLPHIIQPEMITISANRGDRLKVVADAWHMETECHYEWQISFAPRDIDMTSIHAKFEPNGHLFIDVRRLAESPHWH